MVQKSYRVIQWATGKVGKVAIRHFIDNPVFDLAGVYVTDPQKVGKDAGEIASTSTTGVMATDDMEALVALDADCVHFAPAVEDIAPPWRKLPPPAARAERPFTPPGFIPASPAISCP